LGGEREAKSNTLRRRAGVLTPGGKVVGLAPSLPGEAPTEETKELGCLLKRFLGEGAGRIPNEGVPVQEPSVLTKREGQKLPVLTGRKRPA